MHDDTNTRAKRKAINLRIDVFALMLWTVLATLNINKLVTGEGIPINVITLIFNVWLAYMCVSRLWKAADPDAR